VNDKGVPVVKKRAILDQWQVSYYEEFNDVLFPNGQLHSEIKNLAEFVEKSNQGKGFRREVSHFDFSFFMCR